MRRRDFIRLISGVAAPVAISTSLFAQATPKLLVWMGAYPIPPMPQRKIFGFLAAFQDGMREQGQIEGRDFAIAVRTGQGFADLPRLVDEIVELKPDVIVAPATLEALQQEKVPLQFQLSVLRLLTLCILDLLKAKHDQGAT